MGHNRLPKLPASKNWRQVVELLDERASSDAVIAGAAKAARNSFVNAVSDPVYTEAIRLLVSIAQSARGGVFEANLNRRGISLDADASLLSLLEATGRRLDQVARASGGTSDMCELARRSLVTTLYDELGARMPGLFSEMPGNLAVAAREFSTPQGFSQLARVFLTRMTSETLRYWLDRTLAAQVGPDRAFEGIADRDAFDRALTQFSSEATRIIKEFSAGWYAKHAMRTDGTPDSAILGYASVAFRKINDELVRKVGPDA